MPIRYRRFLPALLLCLFAANAAFAQVVEECGWEPPEDPVIVDPNFTPPESFAPIPVVVHVIHKTNGHGDVLDSWIEAEIDQLNDGFSGSGMTFYLHGISRTADDVWFDVHDHYSEISRMLAVDKDRVMNVYVGLGRMYGYQLSGVILSHTEIDPPSTPIEDRKDTSIHETGHYLGLWHTFEGGCSGGDIPPGCLSGGDLVCDTPAQAVSHAYTCPVDSTNTCTPSPDGGPDPIHNFMNYTTFECRTEFTEGQWRRMSFIRVDEGPLLGINPPAVIDDRSAPVTYSDPTFVGDSLYVLSGSDVTFSGVVTLDGQSVVVVAGDADLDGITAIHVKGGSHFEIRRHDEALTLSRVTVEGGSTLLFEMPYPNATQGAITVSDTVTVAGASAFSVRAGNEFTSSGPIALMGGSTLNLSGGALTVGGDISVEDGSALITGSLLTITGGIDVLSGSTFTSFAEVTPAKDVLVTGNGSLLSLYGTLVMADAQSLTFADGGSWYNSLDTTLVTGQASVVVMEADAGTFTLPGGPGETAPFHTTFQLGGDSDLFFYNDGVTISRGGIYDALEVRPLDPDFPWGSLHLYADSATVDRVYLSGAADAGFTVAAQGVAIRNSTVTDSGAGVHALADYEGGQGTLAVDNSLFEDNEYGVVAEDATVALTHSTIRGSTRNGLLLLPYAVLDPFSENVVEDSGGSGTYHGATVYGDAELWATAVSDTEPRALNRIAGSTGDAVRVRSGAFAWLGDRVYSSGGQTSQLEGHENAVFRSDPPAPYAVKNLGGTTVPALQNYWGSGQSPPSSSLFSGPVSYDNGLTSDPTGGSGCDLDGCSGAPRLGGPTARSSAAPSLRGGGEPEGRHGGTPLPAWVRGWMAYLRSRLDGATATEETACDLRTLAALTARDAADVLGEGAANRATLAAWADRLPEASGLEREAAARAARGHVEAAVAAGDYSEALALASRYGRRLPEAEHAVGLGVARASALSGLMRRPAAAALVDSLITAFGEHLDEEGVAGLTVIRAGLDVLMEAEALAGSGGEGMPQAPAASAAAPPTVPLRFAVTGVAPNPTAGALRLGLTASRRARARVEVYDVLGRRVLALEELSVEAGVTWHALDVSGLPSGAYVVRALARSEGGSSDGGGVLTLSSKKFAVLR